MKSFQLTLILLAAAVGDASVSTGASAAADRVRGEVEFSMNAKAKTVKAGAPIELELEYKIAPGWHIGPRKAKNTIPTELDWTLPKGVQLMDAKWPELNYFGQPPGYQGKVVIRAKLQAAKELKPGTKLSIGVRSSWQVCKGICKLGEAARLVKVTVSK
jgi:DsbC/DsbD-like thiol-disulfide interchange protein